MNLFTENEKKNRTIFLGTAGTSILFLLAFISNFTYSIDDYHLIQTYDINMANLGYNYYSTGRFVEGLLAELMSRLNLLPVNRPFGQILFVVALSYLGVLLVEELKVNNKYIQYMLALLFVLNPFYGELYYYSTATVFCGIAVLFLAVGFRLSQQYCKEKKRKYLIFSILAYYCSLATYQIFYLIIFYFIMYCFLKEFLKAERRWKEFWRKTSGFVVPYFVSFILFYLIMKVAFLIKPPTLQYNMDSISGIIRLFFSKEYISLILRQYQNFLFSDNAMASSLMFSLVMGGLLILTIFVLLYRGIKKKEYGLGGTISRIGIYLFAVIGGIILLSGFSIARAGEISYRSFVTYSALILFMVSILLNNTDINFVKQVVLVLTTVFTVTNGIRMGRVALDTYRLNTVETNLANRIVFRLEELEEFNPNAHLIILDQPMVLNPGIVGDGDYNTPALQQFSKVLMINEISGYNFQLPTNEDYEIAYSLYENMQAWPQEAAITQVDNLYIVRLD